MKRILSLTICVVIFLCSLCGCSSVDSFDWGVPAGKESVVFAQVNDVSYYTYFLYEYTSEEDTSDEDGVPATGYIYSNLKLNPGDPIHSEYTAMDGKSISQVVAEYPVEVSFSGHRATVSCYQISFAVGAFSMETNFPEMAASFWHTEPFYTLEDVPQLDFCKQNVPQQSVQAIYYYTN